MKICISKLTKTGSDRRSAIISYHCVRHVRTGNQIQESDQCQPSSKRNQVVKDTGQNIAVIIPLIIY